MGKKKLDPPEDYCFIEDFDFLHGRLVPAKNIEPRLIFNRFVTLKVGELYSEWFQDRKIIELYDKLTQYIEWEHEFRKRDSRRRKNGRVRYASIKEEYQAMLKKRGGG